MATYTKFQCFVKDLAHGVHNFDSNTIKGRIEQRR